MRDPLTLPDDGEDPRLAKAQAIYRANREGARARAVQLTFPMTEQLLGESLMTTLAWHFTRAQPSQRDLNRTGEAFLPWLLAQPQSSALLSDYPFLPALLRFEWGWHRAYHSPALAPLCAEACFRWLQAPKRPCPWRAQPALTVVSSRYPIDAIHRTLKGLREGQATEELTICPGPRRHWALWPAPEAVGLAEEEATIWPWLRWVREPLQAPLPHPDTLAQALARGWLVSVP
ncbi:putative DNA-binding domain-containing protein [Ferrimonas balearica]|uniref:HvfC/BufC family peptide modification chaperone n=1 Tax=Ferrimonas balearica TaxID=44012 RepID=UPI001C99EB1F|nr:putative DNA-binding domain-containing protein [Ferrimonas balearica]MBY5990613.1 DNA-binding domain-containing protein [Ferrimonas balearica]